MYVDLLPHQLQRLTGGQNGKLQEWLDAGLEEAAIIRVYPKPGSVTTVALLTEYKLYCFCKVELPSSPDTDNRVEQLALHGLEAPFLQDEETGNATTEDQFI